MSRTSIHSPSLLAVLGLLAALFTGCRTTDTRETTHVVSGESCESCHLGAWQASAFDHASVEFGRDCARCHTTASFKEILIGSSQRRR